MTLVVPRDAATGCASGRGVWECNASEKPEKKRKMYGKRHGKGENGGRGGEKGEWWGAARERRRQG